MQPRMLLTVYAITSFALISFKVTKHYFLRHQLKYFPLKKCHDLPPKELFSDLIQLCTFYIFRAYQMFLQTSNSKVNHKFCFSLLTTQSIAIVFQSKLNFYIFFSSISYLSDRYLKRTLETTLSRSTLLSNTDTLNNLS